MEDLQDPVPRAQDKSTFKSLFDDLGNSLIVLATITVVSLIVLIIVWRLHPSRDSLGFELAKTSMQALGVIVVGAMAGIATFTYQHKRLRAAKIRDQQHEDWRREVDRIMDERRRQDELLRSVLNGLGTALVKQLGRLQPSCLAGCALILGAGRRVVGIAGPSPTSPAVNATHETQ